MDRRCRREVSIHAPHARGDTNGVLQSAALAVSIHAPHARGDQPNQCWLPCTPVSIHAPHARGDELVGGAFDAMSQFQSTPLMRGATQGQPRTQHRRGFQSTPLMRGATLIDVPSDSERALFQSTPLMRGATWRHCPKRDTDSVSIHAPHARGDDTWSNQSSRYT